MSFEHIGEVGKGGHRSPKAALESKHGHGAGKEINILVLGIRGVGKTALTVRYLTKRYIGDYDSEIEMLYTQTLALDGKHVTLHILDTVGQKTKDDLKGDQIMWADGIILIYAIDNKASFESVKEFAEVIHCLKADDQFPLVILANKSDLIHRKQVSDTDVSRLCGEYSCLFYETSASESLTSVVEVFTAISRQVRLIQKKREKLTRFMSNPAVAAKLQIQQSLKQLAERTWRARTSTL